MPARMWPPGRPFSQGTVARAALAGAAAVLALPALEIGYRLQTHRPALALEDWRGARIEAVRLGDRGRFDAELGWVPEDEIESAGYNTLEHGIRRNLCEKDIRTGAILAVGDAFTGGGSEVPDGETWPAHLERLTALPVLNAGVMGYATDQAMLRAERLLPEVQPKALVVGMREETISRAGYAAFGPPKPYFTLDGGELVQHAPAWLQDPQAADLGSRVHAVLGLSAVLDAVLARAAPGYWLGPSGKPAMRTTGADPVAVTCALLQRLKERAEAQGVRMLLLLQHSRKTVAESADPGVGAKQVAACAAAIGVETIDQLEALRAAAAERAGALDELYLSESESGQMSSKGNRATAELVAAALAKPVAPGK